MSELFDPPIDRPTRTARPHESTSLTFRVEGSTLFLIGEADAGTVEEIAICLERAPALGDVTLDLADLSFMDVAALRAVLQFGNQLAACGRSLTVVNPSQPVALLLHVSGFDRLLLGPGEAPGPSPLERRPI